MFHHFSQDTEELVLLITFAVLTVPGRGSCGCCGCWVPAWGFRWHFFGVLGILDPDPDPHSVNIQDLAGAGSSEWP